MTEFQAVITCVQLLTLALNIVTLRALKNIRLSITVEQIKDNANITVAKESEDESKRATI